MVARSLMPLLLIADPDPYIGRVFEAKLTKDGQFRVISTTSGVDAYLAVLQQPFDLILWDLRLRDTSRLLPRLRALSPNAALILMTTDDIPLLGVELERLDIALTLTKPFGLDTLVNSVRTAVSGVKANSTISNAQLARVGQQFTLLSAGGSCITRVLETGIDSFVVVGAPRVMAPEDFAPGLRIQAQMRGRDALYWFSTTLVRSRADPVPCWEVRMPRVIRRVQRRKQLRIPLQLPIFLENVGAPAPGIQGQTENVGVGGCVLVARRSLPIAADLHFEIPLAESQRIAGKGTVLRVLPLNGESAPLESEETGYRIALRFHALPAAGRLALQRLLEHSNPS